MKKFVLPLLIGLVGVVLVYFGMQIYSSGNLPTLLTQEGSWESVDGGSLQIEEDGSIEGELPLANGESVEFDLRWNEQFATAFDEDTQAVLFSTGLRLRGTSLVFEIETDNAGLSADRYAFQRVG